MKVDRPTARAALVRVPRATQTSGLETVARLGLRSSDDYAISARPFGVAVIDRPTLDVSNLERCRALCGLVGIEIPIVQAPIAVSPALTAAVANAGGLGMLPLSWLAPSSIRDVLAETRNLTTKPFAVNFVLEWDPTERLAIALEAGVRAVSFFWGDPAPYGDVVHGAGAVMLSTVGTADEARRAVAAGVDVVVAQGVEAGGHVWGGVSTMALVPAIVDAVPGTPVIAAGGIADGRTLAAALCLGASGVWLGTRFVASEESPMAAVYKEAIANANAEDTIHCSLFDRNWPAAPHRVLRNSTVRRWEDAGRPANGARPGEHDVVAYLADGTAVQRYSDANPEAGATGDLEALALYAGQSVGLINQVETVDTIIRTLIADASTALAELRPAPSP